MNILLYINANKALVCINHNLLPQIKIRHRRDDLAAATVLSNSLGEVVAVQVVVIVTACPAHRSRLSNGGGPSRCT